MRMTLMGELAGESFEVVWDDGQVRGTRRLLERLESLTDEGGGRDPLAFIHQIERAIGARPHLVVWPESEPDDRGGTSSRDDGSGGGGRVDHLG
jgi:hypothetical protein